MWGQFQTILALWYLGLRVTTAVFMAKQGCSQSYVVIQRPNWGPVTLKHAFLAPKPIIMTFLQLNSEHESNGIKKYIHEVKQIKTKAMKY